MKHTRLNKLLAPLLALGLSGAAAASEVSDFFSTMNTFTGDFSQTVYQDGQLVQQSFGMVQLKKPLKFRWNYDSPEPMQLISDGQRFYHYDIDLQQVTSKSIDEVAGTALASMLSDSGNIDKTFSVTTLDSGSIDREFPQYAGEWQQKAVTFYNLTPQGTGSGDDLQAKRVILGFSADNLLTVFYAEDAYGQNSFLFDNVEQNSDIEESNFQFVPPAGVDVLGG